MSLPGTTSTSLLRVEDDDAIRELLASAMRSAHYEVLVVATGADALRAAGRGTYDLYLTKPFSLEELRFRVEAVLRRTRTDASAARAMLRGADLALDEDARRVWRGEEEVALTPTEFRLLTYLLTNVGTVVSKDQILERVWGYHSEADGRIVETYISALRQKIDTIEPKLLHTSRGFGYCIRPPDQS